VLALTGMTTVFPIDPSFGGATTPTTWPPAATSREAWAARLQPSLAACSLPAAAVVVLAFPGCPKPRRRDRAGRARLRRAWQQRWDPPGASAPLPWGGL